MAAQGLLPLLNGERTVDEIAQQFGQGLGVEQVQSFVAQLDFAGLLHGPVFDRLLKAMRDDFDSAVNLPPAATAALTDMLVTQKLGEQATPEQKASEAPAALRTAMDEWIRQVLQDDPNPTFPSLPKAIMVPHIDYPRGWMNYAAVWGRMRGGERPDRVVILGTNHFGMGSGITGSNKGYETALGVCPADTCLIEAVKTRLGSEGDAKLFENRFDHEREHSIELQIPWIQHCLGPDERGKFPPVFGVLIHDPAVAAGESYDGNGLGLSAFLDALSAALIEVGGKSLIVSSADLSHVGPMFGDQKPLAGDSQEAEQARQKVLSYDRDMLNLIASNKPDELMAAMCWQQNPTRWCSVGNIVATLKVAKPERVQILRYMAAMDQEGMGLVSSAGAVMH
jgi:AmmeMemoRadiSam system protein B